MNWQALGMVPAIFIVLFFVVFLYGAYKMWKLNNKFIAIIFLAVAVAAGYMFYGLYGKSLGL